MKWSRLAILLIKKNNEKNEKINWKFWKNLPHFLSNAFTIFSFISKKKISMSHMEETCFSKLEITTRKKKRYSPATQLPHSLPLVKRGAKMRSSNCFDAEHRFYRSQTHFPCHLLAYYIPFWLWDVFNFILYVLSKAKNVLTLSVYQVLPVENQPKITPRIAAQLAQNVISTLF